MNKKHIYAAQVRLTPREDGGWGGWFIPLDKTTGKAVAFGFPIGHEPDWYESRWEFDEPMIVTGTSFEARFRLLQAERFDGLFNVGTHFDLYGLGIRGVGTLGHGVVVSQRELAPDESLTWPSRPPTFHIVEPDASIPRKLRSLPDATGEVLALAQKLEIVSKLPSAPNPWLLSDREFTIVTQWH